MPRTRKEICEYLGLSSLTHAIQTHVMPLVESERIKLSMQFLKKYIIEVFVNYSII